VNRVNAMTWSPDDLDRIGDATELQIATARPDGTLRPYVTIWGVRSGDDLYIRSAYGPENGWFRRAQTSGRSRIRAGGVERDVTFTRPNADAHEAIDAAYHAKYDRHGPAIVCRSPALRSALSPCDSTGHPNGVRGHSASPRRRASPCGNLSAATTRSGFACSQPDVISHNQVTGCISARRGRCSCSWCPVQDPNPHSCQCSTKDDDRHPSDRG
jgi:hypothetical protein